MDVGRGVHRSLVNKNTLLYYRTEQDANNHPRGQIELSAARGQGLRGDRIAPSACAPRTTRMNTGGGRLSRQRANNRKGFDRKLGF